MGCASSNTMKKLNYLASSPFQIPLDDNQLHQFAAHFKIQQFPRGATIFQQDTEGDEFYIIGTGKVDVLRISDNKQEIPLCTKAPGDFFGEAALLNSDHKRGATVKALDDVEVLSLTRKSWNSYTAEITAELKAKLENTMSSRITDWLKCLQFLSDLEPHLLQLLGNLLRYKCLKAGEEVFEEGSTDVHQMFIIAQGSVKVHSKVDDEKRRTLEEKAKESKSKAPVQEPEPEHILRAGQPFGEIGLMLGIPRTKTVTCKEKTLLLVLGKSDLTKFFDIVPAAKTKFDEQMRIRAAATIQEYNVDFFRSIPKHRYHELVSVAQFERLGADKVVFQEGADGDKFYVILYGECEALREETGPLGILSAPAYFGEIALVSGEKRSATIKTRSRCLFMTISKTDFQKFFSGNRVAYAEFSIKMLQEKVDLQPVVDHPVGAKYFREYLATQLSQENIDFLTEVNGFEDMSDSDEKKLQARLGEKAKQIWEVYVAPEADYRVNLNDSQFKKIEGLISNKDIAPGMFRDARKEILKLLNQDKFGSFKRTAQFAKILEEVGRYGAQPEAPKENILRKQSSATAPPASSSTA